MWPVTGFSRVCTGKPSRDYNDSIFKQGRKLNHHAPPVCRLDKSGPKKMTSLPWSQNLSVDKGTKSEPSKLTPPGRFPQDSWDEKMLFGKLAKWHPSSLAFPLSTLRCYCHSWHARRSILKLLLLVCEWYGYQKPEWDLPCCILPATGTKTQHQLLMIF